MPAFIAQFGSTTQGGKTILTANTISVITATRTSASVPAVFAVTYFGNTLGRKKTIWLGCVTTLLGTALQTGSSDVAEITVGLTIASKLPPKSHGPFKVLTFPDFGYFTMVSMAATLQVEIAPSSIRGAIGSLSAIAIQLASVLSSGIAWGTHSNPTTFSYRLPLGLQNFWPLFMAVCMLYVMDSPTSYLINGDDVNAEKSLRLIRRGYTEEELVKEIEVLKWQQQLRKAESEVKWTDIFKGINRRRTLLAVSVGVLQNLSGSVFASNYATVFLSEVGSSDPFLLVFALNILALGGAMAGVVLMDIVGRRSLALASFSIIFVIDIIIGGLGFANGADLSVVKAIAAFCLLFAFVFAAGLSPLTWLTAAELPTARLRNPTNGFVLLCISLSSLTITYVVPYITDADKGNLGAKTYLIFAFFMLVGLAITYYQFPEVKGRTPAELDEMFGARLPARRFKGTVPSFLTCINCDCLQLILAILWLTPAVQRRSHVLAD